MAKNKYPRNFFFVKPYEENAQMANGKAPFKG